MNIHHLELFYYVAKHGGVSAAARRIPYGIQQPAISAQVIQLENSLGTALFRRRPFALTPKGEELLRFIEPFFSGLDGISRKLRGGGEVSIRIGAPDTVQHVYLPRIMMALRARFPGLHFTLTPLRSEDIDGVLLAQQIDVAIAPLLDKRAEGIRQKEVIRVPMALVIPEAARWQSAEALWKQDRIADALITGPAEDAVCRLFQSELQKRKVEWYPAIQLKSQELITRYVAEGFGIGHVLVVPGGAMAPGTRLLELADFPTIPYGLLWTGVLSPLQQAFLAEAESVGAALAPAAAEVPKAARRSARRTTNPSQAGSR